MFGLSAVPGPDAVALVIATIVVSTPTAHLRHHRFMSPLPPPRFAAGSPRATPSKLLRHVQSERLALEPIRRRKLLKGVEVHDESPWHVRESDLTTRRMHLVQHVRRGGIASRIMRYLPDVVPRRPYFEQQGLALIQGHVLADAPGEREVLAGRQVEILLLAVHLVRQRRHDGSALVLERIPRATKLRLRGPEAEADVVGRLALERANAGHMTRLDVVFPCRRIEARPERDVEVLKRPVEPERLHV